MNRMGKPNRAISVARDSTHRAPVRRDACGRLVSPSSCRQDAARKTEPDYSASDHRRHAGTALRSLCRLRATCCSGGARGKSPRAGEFGFGNAGRAASPWFFLWRNRWRVRTANARSLARVPTQRGFAPHRRSRRGDARTAAADGAPVDRARRHGGGARGNSSASPTRGSRSRSRRASLMRACSS